MYRMNDGVAYAFLPIGDKKHKKLGKFYFDYISIGSNDYNAAMQENVKVEVRIRMLQNKKISTQSLVKIGKDYFKPWRVRHSVNKAGVPITDLTLERTAPRYDFG